MSDPEQTTMKNGRSAVRGTCSVCGTKMFRIVGSGGKSKSNKETSTGAAKKSKKKETKDKGKTSDETTVIGYCVKCKEKRNMTDPEQTTMKNGRSAVRGTCSVCGTKMFRIGKIKP